MTDDSIKKYAKKTFLAYNDPYKSVDKVFPQAIDKITEFPFCYLGVKNRPEIPTELIQSLEKYGHYALHTLDTHAVGGRAIDTRLTNPITGRPMTGSSSGTAINVLLGINDIGIGTDGGGSVLAPAIALHLFSFISPSVAEEHLCKFSRQSTDGHAFTPSIGFMSRDLNTLTTVIATVLNTEIRPVKAPLTILVLNNKEDKNLPENLTAHTTVTYQNENLNASRQDLISKLAHWLDTYDMIISREGPVDLDGLGDTVLGHLGPHAKAIQDSGRKGLVRVVNMADAAALTVPTDSLAESHVLISRDSTDSISKMFSVATDISIEPDKLLTSYFSTFEHYVSDGYGDH